MSAQKAKKPRMSLKIEFPETRELIIIEQCIFCWCLREEKLLMTSSTDVARY